MMGKNAKFSPIFAPNHIILGDTWRHFCNCMDETKVENNSLCQSAIRLAIDMLSALSMV